MGPPAQWPQPFKTALSLLLNSPESMILCWGPELHFFFNDTYFPLLGPRLPWAMGERFDIVWAEAVEQAQPIIDAAMAGDARRFTDLPWKLGTDRGARDTWWTFSYSRVLNADGSIAGLFIFTNETTQRVLADAALLASQQELRALNESLEQRVNERTAELNRLWETSPDLLAVVDFEGRFQRLNPAWGEILGHEPLVLLGGSYRELLHPEDVGIASVAFDTATRGTLPSVEHRYRHADGSYRWISWRAAPEGALIYAIGRDVTNEKAARQALDHAESQLRQAQKVEALGQLTGGVAHDFNNLLTVIRGSVELLARPGISEERRLRCIQAIGDTAERATRLTSQLLAFARQQSLKPEIFDVCAQLLGVGEMLRSLSGSRIEITLRLPQTPLHVFADYAQFDVAIVNLAVNARDAMAGEGRIEITAERVERGPPHEGGGERIGSFIRIALRDTGTGIAPEHLEKVFEPFFTTKSVGQGTGLGLSQVYGFTKQSGGEVSIDTRLGEGTTISLYLPAARADATPTVSVSVPSPPQPRGELRGTVLVVEDNPEVGRFATQALGELGYRALHAANGIEALQKLAAASERIDAVFSDVMMPGMSGLELLHAIRERYPAMRVILASGYSAVLAKTPESGVTLLQKPYSLQQLESALEP